MVYHHIEAQHLEAHVVAEIVVVDVGDRGTQSRVAGYDGLDQQVVDALLELLHVVPVLGDLPIDRGQRPLVPDVHIVDILVEDEVWTLLVYGVVCEVHEFVVQVLGTRGLVLFSCEPSQALLVDKYPQRVYS